MSYLDPLSRVSPDYSDDMCLPVFSSGGLTREEFPSVSFRLEGCISLDCLTKDSGYLLGTKGRLHPVSLPHGPLHRKL